MAKQQPRKLVIDADVARSAGKSDHPVSSACRRFLETVRDVGQYVVMTTALLDEWRRHRSGYSAKWLVGMYGSRLVHWCEAARDEKLRKRIEAAVPANQQQDAAKDVHLIEAALQTDRLIASRDEAARGVFRDASGRVPELKPIVWVNPTRPADDPIRWLRNGAPSEAQRRFG